MSYEKESLWVKHDINARTDEKILALRMGLGWAGYGLYWALIEKLSETGESELSTDYNLHGFDLRSDAATIKAIVENFGLFTRDDDRKVFYSERLKRSMAQREEKSEKARKSVSHRYAKKSFDNDSSTNVVRPYNDRTTIREDKIREDKIRISSDDDKEKKNEIDSDNAIPEFVKKEQEAFKKQFQASKVDWNVWQEMALNNSQLEDVICKQMKISGAAFENFVLAFVAEKTAVGHEPKSISDLNQHLINWVRKKVEAQQKAASSNGKGKMQQGMEKVDRAKELARQRLLTNVDN